MYRIVIFLVVAQWGCKKHDEKQCDSVPCKYERQYLAAVEHFRVNAAEPPSKEAVADGLKRVRSDPSEPVLVNAVQRVVLSIPLGHQVVGTSDRCARVTPELAKEAHSRFGVCGRPWRNEVVVTQARAGNLLGLTKGDVVISVDGKSGAELFRSAVEGLACGSSTLNESAVRATGAASLFGVVRPGSVLLVRNPSGEERSISVPSEHDPEWTSCRDPWKSRPTNIELTDSEDGAKILRIHRFRPMTEDPEEMEGAYEQFENLLREAIMAAANRPLIVDLRGNAGGIADLVDFALSLFPQMRTRVEVGECLLKQQDGSWTFRVPLAVLDSRPVPPGPSRLVFLTDGLTVSGGDFMPFYAQRLSNVLVVGQPTSGELNSAGMNEVAIPGPARLMVRASSSRCVDEEGRSLAGRGATVDHLVELDPADVARGIDTQLARALQVAR